MAKWINININTNLIETETGASYKIKMPHSSEYDGYSFWHPAKLIRSGRHKASVSLGFSNEFTFTLKKYGKGKYNKFETLDEVVIDAEEFAEIFGVIDLNISAPQK